MAPSPLPASTSAKWAMTAACAASPASSAISPSPDRHATCSVGVLQVSTPVEHQQNAGITAASPDLCRARQAQHVLGDVVQDDLVVDGSDLQQSGDRP